MYVDLRQLLGFEYRGCTLFIYLHGCVFTFVFSSSAVILPGEFGGSQIKHKIKAYGMKSKDE